jgi:hypothetical protein
LKSSETGSPIFNFGAGLVKGYHLGQPLMFLQEAKMAISLNAIEQYNVNLKISEGASPEARGMVFGIAAVLIWGSY